MVFLFRYSLPYEYIFINEFWADDRSENNQLSKKAQEKKINYDSDMT